LINKTVGLLMLPLVLMLSLGGLAPAAAPDPYVEVVQLEQARSLGNGRLAQYLSSTNRSLAVRAELAIGRTKQAAGIPLLRPHVHDSDIAVRAMALYALGLIGNASSAPAVVAALRDGSDTVRVAALDATDRFVNGHVLSGSLADTAQRTIAQLLRSKNAIVRARAATALVGFTGTVQATASLKALDSAFLTERVAFVRWHIMWTLFRGYAKDAPPSILTSGLSDKDETVRIEAVRAFGRRGDAGAVALLKPLLADPSWRVQEQTIESIAVLQGGKMTEHLTQIPSGVRTPAPQPDALAHLPAMPRVSASGRPGKPAAAGIRTEPKLYPQTVAEFTGPARGPHPRMRIVTTEGNVYVELYPEWAPLTVENFMDLANRGYYDNNRWFRIVPDFVVQTGDPSGNGEGDAGYSIPAEENPIEQDSFVISMGLNYTNPPNAHAIRDSAGTQFYITLSPQLHLDRDFTVFGKVIGGTDVLGRLIESDKIVRVERLPDTKQ
jgi:peptidyl-prolyl cis-trans isomerase B (cyclophilin B)